MDVKQKLKEWGFGALAQEFIANGITMEVLKICSFEEISILLTPLNLGSKIIFKRKLEQFQKGTVRVEIRSQVPVDAANESIPSSSSEFSLHTATTSEIFEETPPTAISSTTFSKISSKTSPNRILKGKSGVSKTPKKRIRTYTDLFSRHLKDNVFGRSIVAFYEKTGTLDTSNRNKLAKLIISLELEDNLDKSISSERFLQLREAIIKIFPTESKETWYTPYQHVGDNKKINAKGKLVDLYHNNRKNLIKAGVITRRGRPKNIFTQQCNETVEESITEKLAERKETGEARNKNFHEKNQLLDEGTKVGTESSLGLGAKLMIPLGTSSEKQKQKTMITSNMNPPDSSAPGESSRTKQNAITMKQAVHNAMTCDVYPAESSVTKKETTDRDEFKQSATVGQELNSFSNQSSVDSHQGGSLFQLPVLIKEEPVCFEEES